MLITSNYTRICCNKTPVGIYERKNRGTVRRTRRTTRSVFPPLPIKKHLNKKALKVLQLGKFYPMGGGVEKVMYDLTLGLSERGIDCDMLCAAADEGGSRTLMLNKHARLMCRNTWAKVAATMIAPSMLPVLASICRKYDIIHVHHPDPMACLALWCSGYRGRVILHWHADIQKQKTLLRLYRPLQDWLLRRAEIVVGTSPVYLAESPYLKEVQGKAVCLPIGVEQMHPDPQVVETVRRRYAGKKIVFSLGRLVHYKGYCFLVDATRYLDESYVILIGGTGKLKGELQAQIDAQGLQERVKLLGRISDEQLPSYYGACDIFCLSSVQKTEAFGIVQIEAMSCGKPVVATNIPQSGVAWVNAHGISGINVTPGNAKELAEAIKFLTEDKKTYKVYSENAEKRYKEFFTKENMVKQCLKIYREHEGNKN